MNIAIPLALLATGVVWAMHMVLRAIVRATIEAEEEELRRDATGCVADKVCSLPVLRSLESIGETVFAALTPIVAVFLGTLLPDPVRSWLSESLGPATVIAICLAAAFAYWSIFRIWVRHHGKVAGQGLRNLLRPAKT